MDHQVGDELEPVGVVVAHREGERAERDLARPGRLVATDHVVHVVAHIVRGRVRVGAGDRDPVASVELDVVPAECPLGEVVECLESGGQLEVGLVDAEVAVAQRRFRQRGQVLGVEAVEVLRRPRGALLDPVAHDLEVRPADLQRPRVLLHPLHLGRGLRVPAQLEGDEQLVEPAPGGGIGDRGGGAGGVEAREGHEVEVGALPEGGGDRPEHGELLVGGAAVDVDRPEEARGHGLDQLGRDEEGHRTKLPSPRGAVGQSGHPCPLPVGADADERLTGDEARRVDAGEAGHGAGRAPPRRRRATTRVPPGSPTSS